MSHFTRTQNDATWINGYQVQPADLADLDLKTFKALNGDDGGTWAPTATIIVGGSGLQVTGPTVVWGPQGTLSPSSGARWKLGDGDWPVLGAAHPGRTRTLITPFYGAMVTPFWASILRHDLAARQTIAGAFTFPDGTTQRPALYLPLRVHQGATLASAAVTYRIGAVHTALPTLTPRARIVRVAVDGTKTPLTSLAAGGDANGWVSVASPTSMAGYYANGAVQALTLPCDQNNVVDKTTYDYLAEVQDETGISGAPWTLEVIPPIVAVSTTALASPPSGIQTVDGVSVSSQRVLLTAQADPKQNGVWNSAAGAWTRDATCDFAYGLIAPILQGTIYAGLAFQLITPNVILLNTLGATPANNWVLAGTTPSLTLGNVWHAVTAFHTNLTTTQWQ